MLFVYIPDPTGLAGGPNLYAFASAAPTSFWDPMGLNNQAYEDVYDRLATNHELMDGLFGMKSFQLWQYAGNEISTRGAHDLIHDVGTGIPRHDYIYKGNIVVDVQRYPLRDGTTLIREWWTRTPSDPEQRDKAMDILEINERWQVTGASPYGGGLGGVPRVTLGQPGGILLMEPEEKLPLPTTFAPRGTVYAPGERMPNGELAGVGPGAAHISEFTTPVETARMAAAELPAETKVWGECIEFSQQLQSALMEMGVEGTLIEIRTSRFVYSDKNGILGDKGSPHFGVQVGDTIFDNMNPDGVPAAAWFDDLGGEHLDTSTVQVHRTPF